MTPHPFPGSEHVRVAARLAPWFSSSSRSLGSRDTAMQTRSEVFCSQVNAEAFLALTPNLPRLEESA